MTVLRLDYETASNTDLRKRGLDVYSADPSTRVLMCAYKFDAGPVNLWQAHEGLMPRELREALEDPNVRKQAFNAQFERVVTRRVLKIQTPHKGWRCTMALAYMQSFTGALEDIGHQMGLPTERQKIVDGKRLIRLFSMPQKPTKNQPHVWRDWRTDPEDWARFCDYCRQDVIAEEAIETRLSRYPVPDEEWELYELDQRINDRGKPVDLAFVRNAIEMVKRRKAELLEEMKAVTGLANPNSTAQFLPWLQDRGYPFDDLQKDTVKKVLGDFAENLTPEATRALQIRQWVARTSVKKYDAILEAVGADGGMRFLFQFHGASRTGRWAGRRVQTQNLPRTPKAIEDVETLSCVTDCIRDGDYEGLRFYVDEPMEALVGCVRSAFRAPDGHEFVACDLSSIESAVIGWLSQCKRLLQVFYDGKDPYKDFATEFYRKPYDAVTKAERNICKPPTLGCGYRLGGGELIEGKRTGLWGYAENMGVNMSREDAHRAVAVFRETYPEIPAMWKALERAAESTLTTQRPHRVGWLTFEWMRPYLAMRLPSGRRIFYYKPRIENRQVVGRDGEPYMRRSFTYMGQNQKTGEWTRLENHGGRFVEQATQGVARDVLTVGMRAAHRAGFNIVAHIHDEMVTLRRIGDERRSLEKLRDIMRAPIDWAPGLPLGAAGWAGRFYRKD